MSVLHTPFSISSMELANRLYRAPVLEGAGDGPDAASLYEKAFVPNAESGVALIIQGSSCIFPEGRTSPGMTIVSEKERVLALAPMVEAVHKATWKIPPAPLSLKDRGRIQGGPIPNQQTKIVLQLGHGGIFAMEGWHEPYASMRKGPLLAASPIPLVLRPSFHKIPVHVLSTEEVGNLAVQFGHVALWAREAGYDGVQLGSANAKLLDQFISPFFNRRRDEFGGNLRNRARILELIRHHVAQIAGADFPCMVKIPCETSLPATRHIKISETLELAKMATEMGFDALTPVSVSVLPDTTLSRGAVPDSLWRQPAMAKRFHSALPSRRRRFSIQAGSYIGAKRAPFSNVWNRQLIGAVRAVVSAPVLAVGGIRTKEDIELILESGDADLVGIGRPFYAEADLAKKILGEGEYLAKCKNSNRCVPAQMLGMKGACYNPEVNRTRIRSDDPTRPEAWS